MMQASISVEKVARGSRGLRGPRGGRRPNAGRKKSRANRFDSAHASRPDLSAKHAVHVMMRTAGVPRLRQRRGYEAIRRALLHYVDGADFRVVHISIQRNHLHLIVEAANKAALSKGMKSLNIRAARAINAAFRRTGKVFAFRYCAKQIKDAMYARNAISYVLNNWRRHQQDVEEGETTTLFDAFSSAASFGGWSRGMGMRSRAPDTLEPLPVSRPRTKLLRFDWEWFGLIDPYEKAVPLP
jgi:REP element-mobilizing transposase RayT